MSFYNRISYRLLSKYIEPHLKLFGDLKNDLKKSGIKFSIEEYLSLSFFICAILFMIELPIFSFILSLVGLGFLFSIFMSITISVSVSIIFFLIFLSYPKFIIKDKEKQIGKELPFAGIYLSTIASSGLPPHKIFEIFSRFNEYKEVSKETRRIVADMKAFGLDIYSSLERSISRTSSRDLKDLFWAMLSTMKSGGDLSVYLLEKSKTFLNNYRRRLKEFAQNLTIYLEIYLTALILGAIFFTILTSVMSGLGGGGTENIIFIQFFLIFIFIPLISASFIVLIKSMSPGGE